jgi:hypothetical protein
VEQKTRTVATIRATCPTCGDVELSSEQMQVLICSADQGASYAFRCPMCRLMVNKPTDERVVDVLVSSGVMLRTWDMPAEIQERHDGPAISWDDILEFHFLLNDEGWLSRVSDHMAPGERA